MKRIEQRALVVLCGKLSENKELGDVILRCHFETDACCIDLSLIFLSLFMPWNHLSSLFLAKKAALETYKKFCWRVWVKYEPKLSLYVQFYAKNVYQMWKARIEVRANIASFADVRKATWLVVNNWRNETTDIAKSNGKAKIDPTNVELVEFGIQTKTTLLDSIHKTCYK